MNSVYIHIPFCPSICSYCNFNKLIYNEELVDKYLISLENEIQTKYRNDLIKTIYIGGGTPTCLSDNQFEKLLELTTIFKGTIEEFTVETNVELSLSKIELLKKYNVTRVSIGVQTLDNFHLKFLNRSHTKDNVKNLINDLKGFNINVDLIYALPDQTISDIKADLEFLTNLNVNHISTYSLIIEDNTLLKIKKINSIDDDLDYEMYSYINDFLTKKGYIHYEISNYGLKNDFSKHNLVYWNNQHYYGFGTSSGQYINNIRSYNTTNIDDYIAGNYNKSIEILSKGEVMEYEMILGLRKIEGVNTKLFYDKYGNYIEDIFDISDLIETGKLIKDSNFLKIAPKYLYLSNDILLNFINNFKN